jgi:DNA-binding transcriptional ArsR family regulator
MSGMPGAPDPSRPPSSAPVELPPDFDPAHDIALDARSLRGLAHPVRLRIVGLLRTEGPATATRLATRLGLNSGATSYHLRQLAAHGFVVEAPDLGTGRDRWWRAAHRSTWYDTSAVANESGELGEAYLSAVARLYAERMLGAVEEMATLPGDWQGAGTLSDHVFQLSPAELVQLLDDVSSVLRRYRRLDPEAPAPEGTAPVVFQFQAFPLPGALDGEGRPDGPGEAP